MRRGDKPKGGDYFDPYRRLKPNQQQRRVRGVRSVNTILSELARDNKGAESHHLPFEELRQNSKHEAESSPPELKILLYHCLHWESVNRKEMRIVCLRLENRRVSNGRSLCLPRYMETDESKIRLDPMLFTAGFEDITRNLGYTHIGEYHVAAELVNTNNGNRYVHIVHIGGEIGVEGLSLVLRNLNARSDGHQILSLTPIELSRGLFKVNLTAYRQVLQWLKQNGHEINGSVQRGIDSIHDV